MALPRITIDGRLAADPELTFTQGGKTVCRLRLVASSRKQNDEGKWVDDKQLWVTATCWDTLASNVQASLKKGDLVLVHGYLETREWEGRDGTKQSRIVMTADAVGPSLTFRTFAHGADNSPAARASRPSHERPDAATPGDPWAEPVF